MDNQYSLIGRSFPTLEVAVGYVYRKRSPDKEVKSLSCFQIKKLNWSPVNLGGIEVKI